MQTKNRGKLKRLKKVDKRLSRMSPMQHELNIYKAALHALAEMNNGEFSVAINVAGGNIATKIGKDKEGRPVISVKSMSSNTKPIQAVAEPTTNLV